MDRAEYERLLSVAATYRKHLLAAADSNFSLGQFAFAKRQYLALIEPELELGAAEAKYCRQRLLLDHPLFGAATVVYVYLVPKLVKRLEPLLTRAVKNGKRVLIFCTTGGSSEPGNAIGGLAPTRILMRGMLRLYGPSL